MVALKILSNLDQNWLNAKLICLGHASTMVSPPTQSLWTLNMTAAACFHVTASVSTTEDRVRKAIVPLSDLGRLKYEGLWF
jgi:hypothetical protein